MGSRKVREIKAPVRYLASYFLGEFQENPFPDWLHVDPMRQKKHEPSGEKEEDEDASYYPEDNFLLFSHPGLSLRKEYTYPVSIIIQFWISGTIKMAIGGTRFPASTICIEGNKRSGEGQGHNAFRDGPVIRQTNFLEQG